MHTMLRVVRTHSYLQTLRFTFTLLSTLRKMQIFFREKDMWHTVKKAHKYTRLTYVISSTRILFRLKK